MPHVATEGAFDAEEPMVRVDHTESAPYVRCTEHDIDTMRYGHGYDDFGRYEQWVEYHCIICGWLDHEPTRF